VRRQNNKATQNAINQGHLRFFRFCKKLTGSGLHFGKLLELLEQVDVLRMLVRAAPDAQLLGKPVVHAALLYTKKEQLLLHKLVLRTRMITVFAGSDLSRSGTFLCIFTQ
jgi:hypothetical protein